MNVNLILCHDQFFALPQETFIPQTKTIAGFEENANYGFGANQLTGSQKNLLIFGSLAAFFVLFLAGYALE